MEAILSNVGLKLRVKTTVDCPMFFPRLADGVKSFMGTGPAAAASNYTDEKIVKEKIVNALQAFRTVDDFYHLQNQFLVFIAEK
jgi:hypothetical protein